MKNGKVANKYFLMDILPVNLPVVVAGKSLEVVISMKEIDACGLYWNPLCCLITLTCKAMIRGEMICEGTGLLCG